jgi:predicted XRE-type DNA-binding protein
VSEKIKHTESSGNVFADLGLPEADTLLVKAEMVRQISSIVQHRGLTQAETAEVLRIDQPKVSALLRGHLRGFSLERLARFLNALNRDVDIVVRPTSRSSAHGVVRVLTAKEPAAGKLVSAKNTRTTTKRAAAKHTKRTNKNR